MPIFKLPCALITSLFVLAGTACGDGELGRTAPTEADVGADDARAEVGPETGVADTATDTTPADTTPADTTPADTTPADTTPADTTPADTTPADTTPADTTPADSLDTLADSGDAGPADVEVAPICPPPACDAALPNLGATSDWRHSIATPIVTVQGSARHRGRDLYLREGDAQWALAKFAYGAFDDDLVDEDVDIYLLRGCGTSWESLGVATTTDDGDHATVEGIEDSGGWVYHEIPKAMTLGLGRHRLLFVVRGDHSMAEQFIEVLPQGARFVVTDVDGTQTESEMAEFTAVFLGSDPAAQPHGAEALTAFANRGYRIFYLTARPEWLTTRTHEWLGDHGYPPGEVHTTMTFTGSFGGTAETFKTDEIGALLARFPGGVAFGIGNTSSDEAAYENVGIASERAYLYQFDPASWGTRIDDYADLVPVANAQPAAECGGRGPGGP